MKLVQTYNRKLAEAVWWNLLWLTVGALLVTICIQSVATPHNFVAGGILGMAYLVWHWTGTLDLLLWYLLLSVPIWVWGWFFVGRRFLLYTAYGTICTTVFGMFLNVQIPLQTEVYAAVIAGVLHGAGMKPPYAPRYKVFRTRGKRPGRLGNTGRPRPTCPAGQTARRKHRRCSPQ